MVIEKEEKEGLRFHYTWIKSLSGLLYDLTKCKERKFYCERCLHGYFREDLLERHKPECRGNGERAIRIEMPKNSTLEFKNWHRQRKVPFCYLSCLCGF